jgi:hypothetical protein
MLRRTHLKLRRRWKIWAAKRDERPIKHYVWRGGVLYYADGVRGGGRAVRNVPRVPKAKTPQPQDAAEAM